MSGGDSRIFTICEGQASTNLVWTTPVGDAGRFMAPLREGWVWGTNYKYVKDESRSKKAGKAVPQRRWLLESMSRFGTLSRVFGFDETNEEHCSDDGVYCVN
jgi:hypothetical protein